MKKEGEKMGAFIDQVQKNNRLQAEALTYKQEERKRKEAERAKKEQEKQEKQDLVLFYAEITEELTAEFSKIFDKYGDIGRTKAHCFLLTNRNDIIRQAGKNTIGKDYADKNYNRIYKQVETKYKQHFEALEVYKENERLKQVEKEMQEEQRTKKYKFFKSMEEIGEGLQLLLGFIVLLLFVLLIYLFIKYFKIVVILACLSPFIPIILLTNHKK